MLRAPGRRPGRDVGGRTAAGGPRAAWRQVVGHRHEGGHGALAGALTSLGLLLGRGAGGAALRRRARPRAKRRVGRCACHARH